MKHSSLIFLLLSVTISCTKQTDVVPQKSGSVSVSNAGINGTPSPSQIVVCILENHAYEQIIGSSAAPYINSLLKDTACASFTQSFAITHPSQPNYLQFFSGSNQGVTNDNNPPNDPFTTPNLARLLMNTNKKYATYSEDLPSVGYNGDTYLNYARKHNPAANWMGTGTNQIPDTTNKPLTALDWRALPRVCYVIPNQNNDMHNGSDPARITTGDTWVKNHFSAFIFWAKTHNALFILTFDEDNGAHGNHIVTLFIGRDVKGGSYSQRIDHYSVLRTLCDMFTLTPPGAAATATTINFCWK